MVIADNSLKDIANFFSTDHRPVKTSEFMRFWLSLSESEKLYLRWTPLQYA